MTKYRYWTADSDFDWQDAVAMYEEPPPEADEPAEPTRQEALDDFFKTVSEAIPETVPDWDEVRYKIRTAGLRYCHIAVHEALNRHLKAALK